jgi:sphinganine-1-phosphate aldolase
VLTPLCAAGTESILLAARTHKEYYRVERGVTAPEIVACTSAHAAIDKACELMGIRLVKIPIDPHTYKADVAAMYDFNESR